jgi:A/G-specific adenine glycosylase
MSLAALLGPAASARLADWFAENARPLPWRRDAEPYHVWLSEIMLQQTRIEAAIPYYERFLRELPTIRDLADVSEDRLLKLWEGLGYYSRARNLHRAAKTVCERHGGVFPRTYEDIRALPGVGEYTAGAIASICHGLPTPAVDGNVLRVCARLAEIKEPVTDAAVKRAVTENLREVYNTATPSPSILTQALMELGETVCLPNTAPRCGVCPLADDCLARARGTAAELPARATRKEKREVDVTVLILTCTAPDTCLVAIRKRPPSGLLAGLWEFPNTERKLTKAQASAYVETLGLSPLFFEKGPAHTHVFTHIRWKMRSYIIECAPPDPEVADILWVRPEALADAYALPTAFRKFAPAETRCRGHSAKNSPRR